MTLALDPAAARSVVRVRVRFSETDLMGVAHHSSYLDYLEVARVEWLRRRGITYASMAEHGVHLPVVELSLKYRAPVRFDEEMDVETTLREVTAVSVRFEYRILRVPDGALCTEGATRLACVDGRGLHRISDEMLEVLRRPELP